MDFGASRPAPPPPCRNGRSLVAEEPTAVGARHPLEELQRETGRGLLGEPEPGQPGCCEGDVDCGRLGSRLPEGNLWEHVAKPCTGQGVVGDLQYDVRRRAELAV